MPEHALIQDWLQDREPFVVVLLDGEGIIFKDEYLQQGEEGGRSAAKTLETSMHSYLAKNIPSVTEPKLLIKIFLNVKNFGELCARSGTISEAAAIHDFIRGFNETMSLSDIVDIGSGKDKAYDKIHGSSSVRFRFNIEPLLITLLSFAEMFQVFLYNCHCHQIFLGCPSNNQYGQFLERSLKEGDLTGRISLVEGVPFEKEMETVKNSYRIARFPDVFRSAKLVPVWTAPWKSALPARSLLTPSPSQSFNAPPLSRTSTNTSYSGLGVPLSDAAPIKAETPDFQVVRSKTPGVTYPKTVERNKYGQRVDRLDFKSIPRDDLNRLKKLKLCNYHFLLGECPNEENCYHDHERKLTRQELHILTAIARMTPCRFGLECDDPECIYGHRCPQSEPGKKTCFRGDSCRFEPVAHGIDTNIVKVTKV